MLGNNDVFKGFKYQITNAEAYKTGETLKFYQCLLVNFYGIEDEAIKENIDFYKHYICNSDYKVCICQDDDEELYSIIKDLSPQTHIILVSDDQENEIEGFKQAIKWYQNPHDASKLDATELKQKLMTSISQTQFIVSDSEEIEEIEEKSVINEFP